MQSSGPDNYDYTGESGEAYDVEIFSENIRRQERGATAKRALSEDRSVQLK